MRSTVKQAAAKVFRWVFPAFLFALFVFYLTSFSVPAYLQGKDYAAGDDHEYAGIVRGPMFPTVDLWDVHKHPLFSWATVPLYQLGKLWLPDRASTAGPALIFPLALLGLINLVISYRIFSRIFGNERDVIFPEILTVLYGVCFSTWMFSSNAETYILTVVCQNLLLWYCLVHGSEKFSVIIAGVLLGVSVMASTAMVWMAIPVLVLLRSWYADLKRFLIKSSILLLVTFVAVLAVYFLYELVYRVQEMHSHIILANSAFGPKDVFDFSVQYLVKWWRLNPIYLWTTPRAFFIDSIVYTGLHTHQGWLLAFWGLMAVFLSVSVSGLFKNRGRLPVIFYMLLSFEITYTVFFCFFSPECSILYSLPALLPLWVILFLGFDLSGRQRLGAFFAVLLAGIVVMNNVENYRHILKLDHFLLKRHQYYQISKSPKLVEYY